MRVLSMVSGELCVGVFLFFFQAEDGIRDLVRSRGLGDVYKRQLLHSTALLDEKLLVAEIIGVSPDLGNQTVVIDKGLSLIHI